ncbi:MAG: tetratricopeptide repeat protein, partial [Candidatus Zixiibacteriota bacterium]
RALDLNEIQLIPNILSDLVLGELGRVIPKDIVARYAIGSVACQQLARKHLTGTAQNRIEEHFKNIDKIEIAHSGASAAVIDVKALWFQIIDDFNKAEELYLMSLPIKYGDSHEIVRGWSLSNRGLLKFQLRDYHSALELFSESIRLRKKTLDLATLALAYYNRARTYKELRNFNQYSDDIASALLISINVGNKHLADFIQSEIKD